MTAVRIFFLLTVLIPVSCRQPGPSPQPLSAAEREARVDALLDPVANQLIDSAGERKVAVQGFRKEGADFEPRVSRYIVPRLRDRLVRAGVKVIAREDLDRVLKELELQSSDLVERDTAVKLGQISGAEVLVVGTVKDLNQRVYRVEIKLLDLASAAILLTDTVDLPREYLPVAYGGL